MLVGVLAVRRFGLARTLWAAILLSPMWLWALPPVPCTCIRPFFRRCTVSRPFQQWVRSDLKSLASQQEIHRADHGSYSIDLEALGFVPAQDIVVEVWATPTGWAARGTHRVLEDSEACALFVGARAPSGLGLDRAASEEIVCGD